MQVDKTIKGAADKITGLLNPQEGQSEPEKKQIEPQEQTQEKPVEETKPAVVVPDAAAKYLAWFISAPSAQLEPFQI